jgi:hypothetical protein
MSGDFSRNTFRPGGNRSFVRMQQGRLLTDADWNEQGDILNEALRETTADVIGQSGFPEDNPGFALVAAGAGNGIAIMPGEAYVDGIRIMAPAQRVALTRNSGTGANSKWQLDQGGRVAVGDLLNVAGQPPVRVSQLFPDANGKQIFQCAAALSANNNVEAQRSASVDSQPFLISPPQPPLPPTQAAELSTTTTTTNVEARRSAGADSQLLLTPPPLLPTQTGDYIAYLEVWERPIGAIEDPLIRETAFGGPDTAMRDQLVWQVRFAMQSDLVAVGALTLPATCKSFGPGWSPLGTATPAGAMAARAEAAGAATNPCVLPSTGGYRSLENRLYRVEIHNGGRTADNVVTIKWSRDNAIHRSAYSQIDNGAILVDSIGRDDETALKTNDWVEIIDEARLLSGRPGFFGQIKDVNGNAISLSQLLDPDTLAPLVASNLPDIAKLPSKGQVRRWEGGQPRKVTVNSWIKLENGVEVQFAAGRYSTQDYWTIPARTITADIEWPRDPAVAGAPAFVPAMGIHHHYCVLAIAVLSGAGWQLTDCRSLFAPLSRQRSFNYLGGDGQEAMPNPLAPAARIQLETDLRAGCVRGRTPVQGASVRFTVVLGDGRLPNNTKVQTVLTNADGIASAYWSVDAVTPHQQVLAELLDAAGQRTHSPILYTANLSRAAATSFDPAKVPALAGENTVQGAIEKLAGLQQVGCATRIIVEGSDWVSVLKGLKAGENAAVCFQRGTYETQETVVLANLGHITLSGAGGGTRIVGRRRECAIEFSGCASVTVHDLDISTPDGTGAIQNFERRKGSLTIVECGAADVHDVSLSCGAGVEAERTCLTIRGKDQAAVPSVRVQRNQIAAGYAQDGILVTDCVRAVISDNEFAVLPRPQSLSTGKLLAGREWRTRLVGLLVANPKSERFIASEDDKEIRGGQWVASFDSTVPQNEWNELVKANPPKAEDLKTQASFGAYAERIFAAAMTPEHMPESHRKRVAGFARRSGQSAFDALDQSIKRELLVAGEVKVVRFDDKMGRAGSIILTAEGQRILFDSPISQADWNKAIKMIVPKAITKGSDLIAHAEKIATRIIVDEKFRANLGSAVSWYDKYTKALPSFGRQAITCGGRVLANVTVSGNRTDGFVQGVHIGTSRGVEEGLSAGIVAVEGNNLFLRLPGEDVYAACGLFVGNAETIRIERNTLAWSTTRGSSKTAFAQGIRVWGLLGPFLAIAENRIDTAPLGIRVKAAKMLTQQQIAKSMWVASDNFVPNAAAGLTLRVPSFMEKRNNKPA